MARPTTRDRVYTYHDEQETFNLPKLIYRKGKWYYEDKDKPYKVYCYDIRRFLYYLDRRTMKNAYNRHIFSFTEPVQVDNFVEMYADVFGEDEDWFETKYAVLGRLYSEKHKKLPDLPFKLDEKQLLIISVVLFLPKEEALFITTGCGGSGKSTFLNILKQLFENDYYACTLTDLTDPHVMASAVQKYLICGDEIGTKELNLDNLKVLASKQPVNVNPKFERPYTMRSQSAVFYCCNRPPRVDLTDSGITRRLVYYYRNTKIEKPDLTLKDKKFTEEELTIIAAHAYRSIDPNWRDKFRKETWDLLGQVNSVVMFQDKLTYEDYSQECKNSGLKPCGKPNWEQIREIIRENQEKPFKGEIEDEELPF